MYITSCCTFPRCPLATLFNINQTCIYAGESEGTSSLFDAESWAARQANKVKDPE